MQTVPLQVYVAELPLPHCQEMNHLMTMNLDIVRYPFYLSMGPNTKGECSNVAHLELVLSTRGFQVKRFFVRQYCYKFHCITGKSSLISRPGNTV